jgi:hypothetical protein
MIESKAFYRKIEHAFAGTENARTRERFAEGFAPRLLEYLGGALGLEAVHLYQRADGEVAPARRWGVSRPDIGGELASRITSTSPRLSAVATATATADDVAIRELPWVGDTSAGARACSPWARSTGRSSPCSRARPAACARGPRARSCSRP